MERKGSQSVVTVGQFGAGLEGNLVAKLASLDLCYCFQCGVCSGSCPTIGRMEHGPRRIMHMLRLGLTEQVLRSQDIWLCVACYTCSARCPQGIEVADVMATLRNLSLGKGLAKDKEATFSRVFVDVMERHGRLFEPELLIRYYMAEPDLPSLLKQAGLGLAMLRKGKIGLRPERVQHPEAVQAIIEGSAGGKDR